MKLSPAQEKVVEEIRQGRLRSEQSNTRTGMVLRKLIDDGVVGYTDKSVEKPTKTFHGRKLPAFTTWVGLYVVGDKKAAYNYDRRS